MALVIACEMPRRAIPIWAPSDSRSANNHMTKSNLEDLADKQSVERFTALSLKQLNAIYEKDGVAA